MSSGAERHDERWRWLTSHGEAVDDGVMSHRQSVLLAGILLVGCSATPSGSSPPISPVEVAPADAGSATDTSTATATSTAPPPKTEIVLDAKSKDTTVSVGSGQTIVLTLVTNPTTGYDWTVISAPAALGEATSEVLPPSAQGTGAATTKRFVWTPKGPLGPGEHVLELGYLRSFEKGVPPIKSFRVTLKDATGS